MKIVYFIDHLRPDGTQRVLLQLVGGLARRGHQQAVVCLNNSWDVALTEKLVGVGAEVKVVGKLGLVGGFGLWGLGRWLLANRFDVAVTMLFFADVVGRTLARWARIPRVVTSIRARNTNYRPWQRWLARRTMRWADAVVLNSAHVREFAIAEEGASPTKISVIPNAVRVNDFMVSENRAELRAAFGIPAEAQVVGSVGRLTHQKGYDLLLRAVAALKGQTPHVVIAGAGEERDKLLSLADALGLGQCLHLIGYCREIPQLLAVLDIYVQPSRFEGMPNALMEAMAAGCPVVATAVDGSRELIEDGVHGWLTALEDVSGLSAAIQAALNDPSEAMPRGNLARQRVARDFSLERMLSAWEGILSGA